MDLVASQEYFLRTVTGTKALARGKRLNQHWRRRNIRYDSRIELKRCNRGSDGDKR